ncbi:MAG TPA: hypothetical protein VN249_04510, partial [Prolixibacteraceae bacterium]|nr:hypothetical protein [Prolixibacteraceae bacterium]
MKKFCLNVLLAVLTVFSAKAQNEDQLKIPEMPDHVARRETLERDWAAMQQSPHRLAVRDGYL